MIDEIIRHRCEDLTTTGIVHINDLTEDQLAIVVWCVLQDAIRLHSTLQILATGAATVAAVAYQLRRGGVFTSVRYDARSRTYTIHQKDIISGGLVMRSSTLSRLSAMKEVIDYDGRYNVSISVHAATPNVDIIPGVIRKHFAVSMVTKSQHLSYTYERSCYQYSDGSIHHEQ